jgi:hypothetical protein
VGTGNSRWSPTGLEFFWRQKIRIFPAKFWIAVEQSFEPKKTFLCRSKRKLQKTEKCAYSASPPNKSAKRRKFFFSSVVESWNCRQAFCFSPREAQFIVLFLCASDFFGGGNTAEANSATIYVCYLPM